MIWSNGREIIAKLDYDTLEVLASFEIPGQIRTPVADLEAAIAGLDDLEEQALIDHAIVLAMTHMTGLDGVYALADCDNTLFLGRKDHAVAYAETDRAIRRRRSSNGLGGTSPANLCDPDMVANQTEQSITVSGYGAMTVDGEPASIPEGVPDRGTRLLCEAWVNTLEAGVTIDDDDGRLLFGTIFGKTRALL